VPVALTPISNRTDRVPAEETAWDAKGSQRPPEFVSAGPAYGITKGCEVVADPEAVPEQSAEEKKDTVAAACAVAYCRTVRTFAPKEISIPSKAGAHCIRAALAALNVFAFACRAMPPEAALALASFAAQPRDAST
jgi:hypothetical protein